MTPDKDPFPDFRWPHRAMDHVFECVSNLWDLLLYKVETELAKSRSLSAALKFTVSVLAAYLTAVWLCFCYVYFPVHPYSFGAFLKWAIMATAVIWGGIGVYLAAAQIILFGGLLLMMAASFLLSLGYLCWLVWNAQRKHSAWLQQYRNPMLISTITVLLLATFVDGSYRFWDKPFDTLRWARFVFVGISAWAALFCFLMRDQPTVKRSVIRWTVGLALLIGVFVHWQTRHDKPEYFLRKAVIEHPTDVRAWLTLAVHYQEQADALAGDSGDEDHSPPDPTPTYREALYCLNRAVSLGAGSFEIAFTRAQLADLVGDKRASVSFAQEALNYGSPGKSETGRNEDIKWLRGLITTCTMHGT